jgi:hypothetical protein
MFTIGINKMRREGDSNPRCPFGHTAFPVLHNRPLCHLSEWFTFNNAEICSRRTGFSEIKACSRDFALGLNPRHANPPSASKSAFAVCCDFNPVGFVGFALSCFGFTLLQGRNSIQAAFELTMFSAQLAPNRILSPCLAGDSVSFQPGFDNRKLLLRKTQLTFNSRSVLQHDTPIEVIVNTKSGILRPQPHMNIYSVSGP